MQIHLPDIQAQQKMIFEMATLEGIEQLKKNLSAPCVPSPVEVDETAYPRTHLLRKHEGWQAPDPAIVRAYFKQFQAHFDAYSTDKKLAGLLRLDSDRRIRKFKEGSQSVPYEIWRNFLTLTGRAPQDIVSVMAFMG